MTRAVPMDELMLQLAESLRATMAGGGAEIWTGTDGLLSRTVSVPARPLAQMVLGDRVRAVVGRARAGGSSWASVWLPDLPTALGTDLPGDSNGARPDLRVAPVAHLGELLGLIVVRRAPDAAPFADDDERLLVESARQLGLALHNVRLDSALQASLAELEQRNVELQASRLRIVSASDEARRAIERNLHDGAQQHLVALAIKLGLARQIVEDGDPEPMFRRRSLSCASSHTASTLRSCVIAGWARRWAPQPPVHRWHARSTSSCRGAIRRRQRLPLTSAAWRRCRTRASTPAPVRR
jgi:signal transduction histidine kinase